MPYLIDSDWVIDYLADIPDARELLERLSAQGLAISIITYMEAWEGLSAQPDRAAAEMKFDAFVQAVVLAPLSPAVARRCAELRRQMRQQGRRVRGRALDLIIAATAIEYDLTLVTRNTADCRDVPGLTLY
jgi:predicted nucleic acid-binding protein